MTPKQKTDAFVAQYNNTHIDEDGYYGAQCWDVVARYAREKYGCPSFPTVTGGAAGLFTNTHGTILQYFDRVANNPNDANQIPPDGAIIVWSTQWSSPYGHTALKVSGGVGQNMTVFEQNGNNPGGNAYTKSRNYSGVIGWLVPKNQGATMSTTDLSIARILAHGILGRLNAHSGAFDQDLNQYHVGRETNAKIHEFFNSAEGTQWRDVTLPRLQSQAAQAGTLGQQLSEANGTIQKMNTQIAELAKRPTQSQLDELKKTAEDAVKKAMDAQVELEKIAAAQAEAQRAGNAFTRWIGEIINKIAGAKG